MDRIEGKKDPGVPNFQNFKKKQQNKEEQKKKRVRKEKLRQASLLTFF